MTQLELEQEIQRLREENQALRLTLKQNIVEKALSDDAVSVDLVSDMEQFFAEPLSPYYVMVLFYGKPPQGKRNEDGRRAANPTTQVQTDFSAALDDYGQQFYFTPPGCVACLINLWNGSQQKTDNEQLVRQLSQKLLEICQTMAMVSPTDYICISNISTMENGPRLLYRGASSVSECRTKDSPSVCCELDIQRPEIGTHADMYLLETEFWRQIQMQSFFEAAGTLDGIIEASRQQNGFLERTQAVVFSRLEVVLQSIGRQSGKDLMHDPDFSRLMPSLRRTATYQDLREISYDVLALLEDKFYTPPDSRNRKMVSIETFIRENFADKGMGAAMLSEEFKISTSYLSRIFKADMGMSVVDYIHRVRIAEAKSLLEMTGKTITEVAELVGFSNQWVFIRVFKRLEDITPGAYRERIIK